MALKWTYDACLSEARKYKTRSEFQKANGSAYQAASRNEWLDDYTWLAAKRKPNGFYDYKRCYEIAKTCTCPSEMSNKNITAYGKACKEGWIKDYTWFEDRSVVMSRAFTIWTREKCFEVAKKCKSRGELKKYNPTVYRKSRENGWLDDYTWFEVIWEKKWNYETCMEESRKYSSRGEFSEKAPAAWGIAKKNGWLEEYEWLKPLKHEDGYWDYKHCYEVAKTCTCSSEMNQVNGSAYNAARANGWLDDYTWFESPILGELDKECTTYVIYAYEDADNNVCYVGLSKNWKERHASHKRTIHGKSDTVKKYFDSLGKELPVPVILESGLTPEDSRIQEDYWKKEYAGKGWTVLNKGATGKNKSSLGGGFRKWNKEECFKEAKKYKSIAEFQRANPAAQRAARENGWQDEYTWFEKPEAYNKKWNYETCKAESKKYKTRGDFCDLSPGAYKVALQNKWLDEYKWFTKQRHEAGYWNYETCKEEAKKYTSKKQFQKECGTAYHVARTNGWLDEWFQNKIHPNGYWSRERCLEEAKKYTTVGDFKKKCGSAYNISIKNGWYKDYTWLLKGNGKKG